MKEKYSPDMATLLRETDPAKRRANRLKALESVARPTPAGFFRPADDDVEALPSTGAATGAEERPVTKAAAPAKAARRWPATWLLVLGCIGVGLTAMLTAVVVMLGRTTESAGAVTPARSAAANVVPSVTATANVVPSVTATASATVMPSVTATASAAPAATAGPKVERQRTAPPPKPKDAVRPDARSEAPAISPEFVQ
jgi:hypothetical protein